MSSENIQARFTYFSTLTFPSKNPSHKKGYKSQKNLVFSSKGLHLSHVAHVGFRKEGQVYPYEGLQD